PASGTAPSNNAVPHRNDSNSFFIASSPGSALAANPEPQMRVVLLRLHSSMERRTGCWPFMKNSLAPGKGTPARHLIIANSPQPRRRNEQSFDGNDFLTADLYPMPLGSAAAPRNTMPDTASPLPLTSSRVEQIFPVLTPA